MARKRQAELEMVRIRVLVAFDGMYAGDTAAGWLTPRVQGWINAGMVAVDGTSETGPGAAEPDDQGGVALGTGDDGPTGDEPGEGFGSGGYGASAG